MGFLDKIIALFAKEKKPAEPVPAPVPEEKPARLTKACKNCGKTFTVDPAWEHIPNYCRDCRRKFAQEKEEKQRAGGPRKIRRKCKACGNFFSFPNTLEHYPSYCPNCRKAHQAAMKDKYRNRKNAKA